MANFSLQLVIFNLVDILSHWDVCNKG